MDPALAEITARAASRKPLTLYEASSYVQENTQHPIRLFAVAEMIRARKLHKKHPKLAWLQPPVLYRACFLALPTYAPPVLALARGLLRNDFFETERMLLGIFDRPLYDPATGQHAPQPLVSLEAFGMLAPQYPLSIKSYTDEKFHRLQLDSVARGRAMALRVLDLVEEGLAEWAQLDARWRASRGGTPSLVEVRQLPPRHWAVRLTGVHLQAIADACKVLSRCSGVAAPVTDLRLSFEGYARGIRVMRALRATGKAAPHCIAQHRAELVDAMALIRYYYPHRVGDVEEQLAWQAAVREAFPARPGPPVPLPPRGDGKIRVGYISPDFRSTAVGWFVTALLGHFNPARFEVYVYNNHTGDLHTDPARLEFRQKPVHWFESGKMHENTLVDVLQTHRPDVLIDLLCFHRPTLLARKPARRVLTYLGYPGKAHIEGLDGRVVDRVTDPEAQEPRDAPGEPLVRLPRCFLCFTPLACYGPNPIRYAPDTSSPRRLRIGVFNKSAKFTNTVLAAWREILARRPDAELWFKRDERYMDPAIWDAFRDSFGADRARVLSFPFCDRVQDYFAYFDRVDLTLDTWPYSGTTTTCSSLFMGVPVLTVSGRHHVERVTESLLVHCGRGEWVCGAKPAVRDASDPERSEGVWWKSERGARSAPESRRDSEGLPPAPGDLDRMPHWESYVDAAARWPLPEEDAAAEQARREALRKQFMATMDPAAFMRDWEAMLEQVVGDCPSLSELGQSGGRRRPAGSASFQTTSEG
jgi:hypothetical protein